jgi:hypothetical protein
MTKTIKMMVGAALVLGAAVPAFAQDSKPVGLSLRAGLFVPTDRGVRDVADSWFAGGLDYKLRDMPSASGQMNSISLSLDFAGKSGYRTVPILANYVVHHDQLYVFGGLGLSFSRFPVGGGSEDKTEFAYQVGAGYDFQAGPTPLFVEGKFMGNGRSTLNGFGFFAGIRF